MPPDSTSASAVFIRMASRPIPRVLRMMRAAREADLSPVFCGAHREPDLADEDWWGGYPIRRVGPHCPLLNGRRPILYARSVWSFNRAVSRLLRRLRPSLVHASDIEALPAAVLYAGRHRVPLVYNIHDNLAQRYPLPGPVRMVLNWIEGLGVLLAGRTLVPEPFRRASLPPWSRARVAVVRNTPEETPWCDPPPLDEGVVLFYGGWIDRGRGLEVLLALVDRTPRSTLRLAGEGDSELTARMRSHPRVEHLGFLTHREVLEETAACHFVPALYDPRRIINRFAASNKLAEAMAVGRPVLANSEMAIVAQLGRPQCVLSAPYGDVDSLSAQIRALTEKPERYLDACRAARRLYEQQYSWTTAEEAARDAILGALESGRRPDTHDAPTQPDG